MDGIYIPKEWENLIGVTEEEYMKLVGDRVKESIDSGIGNTIDKIMQSNE